MYKQLAEKIAKLVVDTLKKENLREMARNGEDRPKARTKIAKVLSKYAKPSAHENPDPEFAEYVKKELSPHWFSPDSRPLDTVVRKMLDARSPAQKAQATRALKNYAQKRATEIGSTPTRVTAGVRAVVTKRRQKAG